MLQAVSSFGLALLVVTLPSVITESAVGLDGGFRQVALDLHNTYRALSNAPPLLLSTQLNIEAHARAEELAKTKSFELTFYGPTDGKYKLRNVWAYFGELRPLAVDTRDATNSFYTKVPTPETAILSINDYVLYSNTTKFLGVGVGTADDYTIVIAYYM